MSQVSDWLTAIGTVGAWGFAMALFALSTPWPAGRQPAKGAAASGRRAVTQGCGGGPDSSG
jgi:hypothetical protein